jgi:hypothetical protein
VLINADNGSRDGTAEVFRRSSGTVRRLTVATPAIGTGKGTNIMAIFHAALDLGAEGIVVLDGDVRSVEPWWIGRLLRAVAGAGPAMAVPVYRRNRYEGNTTNHLASPLLAGALGVHVQQPIAGDFAFNRGFVERAVTWSLPESAQLYGIDIHLTGNAAREEHAITEVPLGRKIHNPGFPKILPMSQQVIDSLLHVLAQAGRPRPVSRPYPGLRRTVDEAAVRPDGALIERTIAKVRSHLSRHHRAVARMFPSTADVPRWQDGLVRIDSQTWPAVLADALAGLAAGHAVQARDHLVALYLCRVRTYWDEIEQLAEPEAIDVLLDAQTTAVVDAIAARKLAFATGPPMAFNPGFWAEGAR